MDQPDLGATLSTARNCTCNDPYWIHIALDCNDVSFVITTIGLSIFMHASSRCGQLPLL